MSLNTKNIMTKSWGGEPSVIIKIRSNKICSKSTWGEIEYIEPQIHIAKFQFIKDTVQIPEMERQANYHESSKGQTP